MEICIVGDGINMDNLELEIIPIKIHLNNIWEINPLFSFHVVGIIQLELQVKFHIHILLC